MSLRRDELNYHLPSELIAQHPLPNRSDSRLLVIDRGRESISHQRFRDIAGFLNAGDRLVVNNTRVMPVRLYSRREGTGGTVEIFLLEERGPDTWRAMTGSGGKLQAGEELKVSDDPKGIGAALLVAKLSEKNGDGTWEVNFSAPGSDVRDRIEQLARMPLPPYITRERFGDKFAEADRERYQTVYAKSEGAVAAPTAGLHFTDETFAELASKGVKRSEVTLHVGPGTFKPVKAETLDEHPMHSEYFELSPDTASEINATRQDGGRCIAVGTTSVRTLESCVGEQGSLLPQRGETDLLIQPGHKFGIVDAMVTNFHMPHSTLLALIMAFAGNELTREAYRQAVAGRYRFLSYGDAMLIV